MLYSFNLLRKFITLQDTPASIAKNLTHKTCEIDHVITRTIPTDVVIGKVIKLYKHPNADTLFVCEVDCGSKGIYKICTGGENIANHQYVPVALPGCYLPEVNLKIEPRTMRGEISNGMICSKEELGIKEDTDKHRIWLLSEDFDDITDADCGCPLVDKYPRLANTILDVDNKAINNRPDLTGHFGLANELYALYTQEQKQKKENIITFQTLTRIREDLRSSDILTLLENTTKTKDIDIIIQSPYVRSYTLIKINAITVKKSSFYTRLQISDLETKPRNNRVDISNIFMNLYGQPVHFFDADTIKGNIIVRQAKDNEEFVDLFDKKYTLTPHDIVIADEEKILALAGVIGGKNSGVTEKTKNIAIELANFDPVCVRKTSQRYGLRTDAVIRYEKNINPVRTIKTFPLLLDTLKEYTKDIGFFSFDGIQRRVNHDIIEKIPIQPRINIETDKISQILFGCSRKELNKVEGYKNVNIKALQKQILANLTALGFTVLEEGAEKTQKSNKKQFSYINIEVPSRRGPADIKIPEDIYEEIVRVYGYEKIPLITPSLSLVQKNGKVGVPNFTPIVSLIRKVEDVLIHECRCDQVETYPRVEQDLLKACKRSDKKDTSPDFDDLLSLQNPLTPENSYIRDSMIYNLVGHIKKNHKFFDELTLFDIGKVRKKTTTESHTQSSDLPICDYFPPTIAEHRHVGIIAYRKKITNRQEDLLLTMKQILEAIGKKIGATFDFAQTTYSQFHPKKQGNIIVVYKKNENTEVKTINTNIPIGFLGQLHPLTLQNLKIHEEGQVVYAELDLSTILSLSFYENERKTTTYLTLTDQLIVRDLCFVLPKNASYKRVIDVIKNTPGVYDVHVFDIFDLEDKKSLSITIDILGDGSYTTNEINAIMNTCIQNAEKVGAKLRDKN